MNTTNNMKKNILIITSMANGGGMEERYNRLLPYIMDDFNIFFVLWKRQEIFYKLQNQPNITFYKTKSTSNKNLNKVIKKIIDKHNIHIIEVNFASFRQFLCLDYSFIKHKNIAIIGVIHFLCKKYKIYQRKFYTNIYRYMFLKVIQKYFDTIVNIRPTDTVGLKFSVNTKFIPNTSNDILSNVYKKNTSKKVLIIARIFKTTLPMIESYIQFLQKNNYEIELAGNSESKFIHDYLLKKYHLVPNNFLGYLEINSFLKSNSDKYLFVCAIDTAALDAMSLGFPVLSWSLANGLEFIKKSAFEGFCKNNFSFNLHSSGAIHLQEDLQDLEKGKIAEFNILQELREGGLSKELVGKKYKDFLNTF